MRLHALEITAFGPFADTATVDFDALSEPGLFLLAGPTGAGKTSVLDAVCFALYGAVPGERNSAKRLRCDTAPEGRAPRVVLELTLAGRRFRITRSPQWTRPKKRGSGETSEQASVLVEERTSASWQVLSNRIDEAGHLLTGLVGMTMPQFCQVAMLPQGQFQVFLRASSEDRHKLLQQLFSTQRFEDIEKWLRERSRVLHRDSQVHHRRVLEVTNRVLEAGAAEPPGEQEEIGQAAATGALRAWADTLAESASEQAAAAAAALTAATDVELAARADLDEGRRLVSLHERRAAALRALERLEEEREAQADRRSRLDLARRAAPVPPLQQLAVSASRRRERSAEAAATALGSATSRLGEDAGLPDVEQALADARAELAHAQLLMPRQRELTVLSEVVRQCEEQIDLLHAEQTELSVLGSVLPDRLAEASERLEAARRATAELDGQRTREHEISARLEAHARLNALAVELDSTEQRLADATQECLTLKEIWLDLREARLSGMAAEIASELAVGASCPVCGSADHPSKAQASPDAPDAVAEKAARSALDDAELTRTALDAKVRDLTTQQALASQTAGPQPAAELEGDLRTLLSQLEQSAGMLETAQSELGSLEKQTVECRNRQAAVATQLAVTTARLTADRATHAQVAAEVGAALEGSGCTSLDELATTARARVEVLTEAVRAVAEHQAADAEAGRAEQALDECVRSCGFESVTEAADCVLPADAFSELERAVVSHDEATAAARSALDDPAVRAAAELPVPDLERLTHDQQASAQRLSECVVAERAARDRAARLTVLLGELDQALAAWAPVRAAHAVAAELASFVEGKSADNELRMRLSAFVLAWRLTQVVAAANERLARMSDQRYTLEHTGRRGAGETRGGLSLLVRDVWSGEARDPATLSGGETFVVSLALALGLADVVTQEAGGADLDTLFVDEGFGALDADTLEDVMGTLDTLRDGGRVVGVVSHVPELRSRIPTRLLVSKDRQGSTIALERSVD
jgi:DNA repair protein SbcC/Rad50